MQSDNSNDQTVYVIVGCIRTGIPDEPTYQAIYDLDFSRRQDGSKTYPGLHALRPVSEASA